MLLVASHRLVGRRVESSCQLAFFFFHAPTPTGRRSMSMKPPARCALWDCTWVVQPKYVPTAAPVRWATWLMPWSLEPRRNWRRTPSTPQPDPAKLRARWCRWRRRSPWRAHVGSGSGVVAADEFKMMKEKTMSLAPMTKSWSFEHEGAEQAHRGGREARDALILSSACGPAPARRLARRGAATRRCPAGGPSPCARRSP